MPWHTAGMHHTYIRHLYAGGMHHAYIWHLYAGRVCLSPIGHTQAYGGHMETYFSHTYARCMAGVCQRSLGHTSGIRYFSSREPKKCGQVCNKNTMGKKRFTGHKRVEEHIQGQNVAHDIAITRLNFSYRSPQPR